MECIGQTSFGYMKWKDKCEEFSEGFSFDATDVKTEVAQRNQIFGDAQKLLEVGLAGDTDTALEKIKTDSEGAGFQSVLDEYQRQIDEFLAAKDK